MKNFAEFQIVGRIGKIKIFDNIIRVTIAANYRRQDEQGNWSDDTHWNEVIVFNKKTRDYISEHAKQGSLAFVRGRLRQDSFTDASGEQRFATNLIAMDFALLA